MGPDHPWKGVGFLERKKRRASFKKWLSENQDGKLKHGTVRHDGKIFIRYDVGYRDGENWTSPEMFFRHSERNRNRQRQYRKDPEYRRRYNEYINERYANKEERLASARVRGKRHRQKHPEMVAMKTRRRYAEKKRRTHPDLDKKEELKLFRFAAKLTKAMGLPHHVDHIIPLSSGGWHHHENLQVLPDFMNLEKGTDPFWEREHFKSWRDVPEHLWPDQLADQYKAML